MNEYDNEPEPEDFMTARDLLGQGFYQVSSKYRTLVRLPQGQSALKMLKEQAPREYAHFMQWVEQMAAERCKTYCRLEERVLTPGQFKAFKKLGGGPYYPGYSRKAGGA